ncbi:phospholipase D-like domain-containing protein [Lacinutrix himadriensis]|uniref:phospholipase D-like domain-containing protein n=1 Tax=Lacinutrix himadriensis TaxID=641549 RepID=UPI0006E3A569|nr:phospholipase D-like domain-containing protein [Lacinutrix himadriensis]
MAEGLKLYNEFKKTISEIGEIKMAWFTTFNLSLDFFEKYVLSALVQTNPFDIKNIKDFEALNDRIVNADSGSVDVKVFHDYRAMRPDIKRTSVQTIAIKPKSIGKSFTHGVFHPKVTLLVNKKNEAWLVTGSANLTLSAWSKNSESVVFKKIDDKVNAQAITDFFLGLLPNISDRNKINSLNIEWQKGLKPEAKWKFIHSISKHRLLDYIKEDTCKDMFVWSPYFSDEFLNIIKEDLSWVNNLNVIPDLTTSGAMRLSSEVVLEVLATPKVKLHKDLYEYGKELLVHAKVWCTTSKLAIGSWNFTKAGLNIAINANNIEAGVVEDINDYTYQALKQSFQLKRIDVPKGMRKEDIDDEKKELLFDWTINCQIYVDWSTYQYRFESEDNSSFESLFIDLPGKKNRISAKQVLNSGVSFYKEHKSLLKDRLFTVYDKEEGGNKVYLGVIIELNPMERPSVGFESLSDLLRAWSDRKPENKSQYHQINYQPDTETGEELSDKIIKALKGDYSNAWFTMFLAFEQIRIRLEEAKTDARELSMIGYRIPGSVSQLSEHLMRLKEQMISTNTEMSSSFIWFMINEETK